MNKSDDFTISVSLPDMSSLNAGFFTPFFEWVAVRKEPMETEIKKLLQDYARDGHREWKSRRHYIKRSGNLADNTHAHGTFGQDLKGSIELYVDPKEVVYAGWIITGKRQTKNGTVTWNGGKGDPFIDEALIALKPEITQIIINFFNEAIMEFNRRK